MKASNVLLLSERNTIRKNSIKAGTAKIVKILLVILMVSWISFLSSCIVPGPGYGTRGGMHERHDRGDRHGHDEGHGHDNRHD